MNRNVTLRSLVNNQGFGLEIGPSHAPVFPRSEGFNIETLDHADADSLRSKYKAMGIDVSAIEDVTYVSDGRPIHEIIPRRGEYDFIFSSHVIEHVTDVIGYFQSCELLLKPNGIAALAVPDKRYTFDFMQPISTTGQALEAHHRSTGRHSLAAIYDFNSNHGAFGGQGVWTKFDSGAFSFTHSPQVAKGCFDAATNATEYQDVHGWIFTPNSFRLLMHDLREIGMTSLQEIYMMEMGVLEFHVALSRDHIGNGLDRMQIQKNIALEQAVSNLQILAPDNDDLSQIYDRLIGRVGSPASPELAHEPESQSVIRKALSIFKTSAAEMRKSTSG